LRTRPNAGQQLAVSIDELAFSADGALLAGAAANGGIVIWRPAVQEA